MKKFFQIFIKPKFRKTFDLSNKKSAMKLINDNNVRKDLYRTIYNYEGNVEGNQAIIDKVFLDFDPEESEEKLLEDVRKVSNLLNNKNIKHSLFFSGRGFHIFVYTNIIKAKDLINPRTAIRNFVNDIIEITKASVDYQVVGDLMRVARIPNTMNMKTRLYCIPLDQKELEYSIEYIKDLATSQRFFKKDSEGKPLDLKVYDTGTKTQLSDLEVTLESDEDLDIGELGKLDLPSCVLHSLKKGRPNFQERFMIITCLRDLAFSKSEVSKILMKFLTEDRYTHCIEEERQLDYLFNRQDLLFPSCSRIKEMGFHVKGCTGNQIYE